MKNTMFNSPSFPSFIKEMEQETNLQRKTTFLRIAAQKFRCDAFEMIYKRGNGHWGGSSSCAEILTTLYFHIMHTDPANPALETRDRFILSKGHAAPMLYTLLAYKGFLRIDELPSFRKMGSRLQGHPCLLATPGIELSTGPLGHGISVGTGMALAARLKQYRYWTFVLVGEGCLNEGQSWEAILSAAKFRPPRLVIMVDYNKVQLDGPGEEIMPLEPLTDKLKAFRLNVSPKIYDGHKIEEILQSWDWVQQNQEEPCVIIYKTHKGKGVSFMKDKHQWHGSPIDEASYTKGKIELENDLITYYNELR